MPNAINFNDVVRILHKHNIVKSTVEDSIGTALISFKDFNEESIQRKTLLRWFQIS